VNQEAAPVTTFPCPNCSHPLRTEEAIAGKVRCSACGAETLVADASPAAGPLPPGYLMLFEIGRTPRGIAYAARSRKLGRVVEVELETTPTGRERSDEEVPGPRVQHAGILQEYESGEHDGKVFHVREYCSEGSLDKKLAAAPLKPADAAVLVARLASAIGAAHDAGVIHRHLQPARILLAEDGSPKVAGLAQTLAPETPNPSYLAPEQAEDKKDIGPAADVYALGAILYECLTGRPPFRAATAQDTLAQVMAHPPAPPSLLNPAVPRELESIALKCLAKEPANRFASARELGEALERCVKAPTSPPAAGSPVRALAWARRNPVAASLLSVVVLLTVGAFGAITWLHANAMSAGARAQQAEQQAEDLALRVAESRKLADDNARAARDHAKKIKEAEQKALESARLVRAAQEKADDTAEELENALVAALLRPIGPSPPRPDARGRNTAPLGPVEADALAQLGGLKNDRVRLRVIESALNDPQAARVVIRRPEWIVQCAVGLDRDRRKQAETILLDSKSKGLDLALARARLGVELNVLEAAWARKSASALAAALARTTDPNDVNALAQTLNAVSERLPREDAFPICDGAAKSLALAMSKSSDPASLRELARAQSALGERLPPRLASQYAGKAFTLLVAALKKSTTAAARQSLSSALVAMGERLNESDAAKAAELILDGVESADPHTLAVLALAMKSANTHLDDEASSRYAGKTVDAFLAAIGKTTNADELAALASGLEAIGAWLDAKESASLAEAIAAAAGKAADPNALRSLARALKSVSARLDAGRTAEHSRVADALVAALGKATAPAAVRSLGQGLELLSGRLDSRPGTAIAALLAKAPEPDLMSALGQALLAVADRMDAKASSTAASSIVDALAAAKRSSESYPLARALKAVSDRLDALEANTLAGKITDALAADTKPEVIDGLAQGLAAVVRRLPDKQAAGHAAKLADLAAELLKKESDSAALTALGQALEAVGVRLDEKSMARSAEVVLAALAKTNNSNALSALTAALDVLVERLPAEARSKHAGAAANSLLSSLKEARVDDLHLTAGALAVVLRRLNERQASTLAQKAATVILAVLSRSADAVALYSSGQALSSISKWLGAPEAKQSAAALLAALHRQPAAFALDSLTEALAALGGRLASEESNKVLEALVVLTAQASEPANQSSLARTLKSVAGSRTTEEIAAVLAHPLCAGAAQRALLESLGARCRREFANSRQFMDHAAANGIDFAAMKPAR
jgi:hypothetical protein